MPIFHVTFGQKYAHETHPTLPAAHPDMLLEVHATDEATARNLIFDHIGSAWAFIYPHHNNMDTKISPITGTLMFPRGATHILNHHGITTKEP